MAQKTNNTQNSLHFSSFTEQKARHLFQLQREFTSQLLDGWFDHATQMTITDREMEIIELLHAKLSVYVNGWNKDELKIKFIAPLIELVNFDNYDLEISSFSERALGIKIKTTEIKGVVDLMVATGISAPEHPFFFIHEYKKEQDSSGDALGQLLATMFVAQELNKIPSEPSLFETKQQTFEHVPIYGVYVIGRLWFFVRLAQKNYHISQAYDTVKKENLYEVFKLLKAQKEMIVGLVKDSFHKTP